MPHMDPVWICLFAVYFQRQKNGHHGTITKKRGKITKNQQALHHPRRILSPKLLSAFGIGMFQFPVWKARPRARCLRKVSVSFPLVLMNGAM